ncbi:MAG: hypothetical protein Q9217_005073 [Psora testacea]
MDLLWRPGYGRLSFLSHADPIALPSKHIDTKSTSLLALCKEVTPPCHLNPFLFNGHLQTFWTAVRSYDVPVYYKRHNFSVEDPAFAGTFAVDFAVPEYEGEDESLPPRTTYLAEQEFGKIGSDDDRPMLVMLHGLSGGSHEIYLRHVLKPMLGAGWEACVVNSRGCAKSKITSAVMYNARATWDVRQTVKWLRQVFPNRPLFGIGFSLGANILVNYVAEEGADCQLKAAVVISNPWNLDVSSLALQRTWLGLRVYLKAMGTNMKSLFEEHVEEIAKNPRVDINRVRKIRYLFEFDRELQGPSWGYPTEGAYYRDASSCDSLLAVKVPLFAINAEDDPIAVNEALPLQEFRQNHYAVLCTTSTGGHLSWFESGGGRWFAKPACQFLQRIAADVDFEKLARFRRDAVSERTKQCFTPGSFVPMRRKLQLQSQIR